MQTESAIVEYDFDAPIGNPIDFTRILNNWNLLNTIAATLGIPFEGDSEKYTSLYDLLFGLNTPVDPISPLYQVCETDYKDILAVFRKKDRFLNLLELYREE